MKRFCKNVDGEKLRWNRKGGEILRCLEVRPAIRGQCKFTRTRRRSRLIEASIAMRPKLVLKATLLAGLPPLRCSLKILL